MAVLLNGITLNNVIIGQAATPPAGTPVVTQFGDARDNFPSLNSTGRPGNHVRSYVAGVFDVDADLAAVTPAQTRVGVIYYGNATTGELYIVIDKVVVYQQTLSGGTNTMNMYWETAFGLDNPAPFAYKQFLDQLGIGWQGDFWQYSSDFPTTYYAFDTSDCKLGWYIDQNTGLGDGVLDTGNSPWAYPTMMYTSPQPQPTFTYPDVFTTVGSNIYDTVSEVNLYANLGGNADSWTGAGGYFELPYPATTTSDPLNVDGGRLDSGDIDNWRYTESFPVNGTNRDPYIIPAMATQPPATAGLQVYPNVATTIGGSYKGYIEVLNYGLPILYEQWYAKP